MNYRLFSLLAAVAVSLPLASHSAPAKSVRDGIAAWQRSDYAAAVAIWRPLAQAGDADAAFNLGQAYRLGRGVPVDLAQAQSWLEKSANAGHLDAQTTLGLLLFDSGNRPTALRWLKQAAQRGEPRAMLVYGTALFNGDGVEADPVTAYAYVSRSAAQGLEPAKTTLQEMDNILPVELRQKAVKIALQGAAEQPAPSSKPVETEKPKAKTVASKPAETKPKPPASKPAETKAKPPASKPAPKTAEKGAPVKPAAAKAEGGSWRIQLGAFSKRASAEALYAKVSSLQAVSGHSPVYVSAGAVTRLQIGGFASRDAAQAACSALSAKGHACFPVAGK